MNKLTHLSLFTGIGGIDIAAEAAGFITVAQCENAAFPLAVLEKHWPDIPRFSDINTLTKERFIEKTGLNTITLISGGFPCQPFSQAGKRRGFTDKRHLWPEMYRVIKELRPRWVIGENVVGFVDMGFNKTVSDLEKADYCVRAFIIPACAVGAWHERKRVFIIAFNISDTDCNRRLSLDIETVLFAERERIGQSCGADGTQRESAIGQYRAQSFLGRVANGLPSWVDGHIFWEREPDGLPRMTEEKGNRAERIAALGNAVVPQQIYPILKYIADIESLHRGGDNT